MTISDIASPSMAVVVPLPPSYRGGTEEYAYRLVERFSSRVPVELRTTTARWNPLAPCLGTGSAHVERMPALELFERPLLVSPRARAELARTVERASALQVHMPFPGVEGPVVEKARRAGVPSVLTYHMDADLSGVRPSLRARLLTRLYRRWSAHPALEACDAIVSNSWGYARASPVLSRHLNRVRVIHKGIDPARLGFPARPHDRHRPACVPESLIPPGSRSLLFVGRLVPYKGVPVLLEAFARLLQEEPHLTLLIAGRGPLREALVRQAHRSGIADRVAFLGFVPDSDLGPLYRYSDLVVAPSLSPLEATATALEEASACGTPVVGTTLPGTEETVPNDGRRGLLVPPGDAEALARAILRMLAQERPGPVERIRSWDDVAHDYWNLFHELGARLPEWVEPSTELRTRPEPSLAPSVRGAVTPSPLSAASLRRLPSGLEVHPLARAAGGFPRGGRW
jgi:glycosyltransferase involved in cell wall biosynthesis